MKRILPSVLIVFFMISAHAYANGVPKMKRNCSLCHFTHNMVNGTAALRDDVTHLCVDCHADRKSPAEHVIGVKPKKFIANLVLDEDGLLTCITCHDPHGKSEFPKMLRALPSALCNICHLK